MEPTNPNTQGDNMQKLEQDLAKISQEATQTAVPAEPITPPPAATPEISTPPQPQSTPPVEAPKGGSVLMKIATSLLAIAIVAAIVYVLYVKFISQNASQTQAPSVTSSLIPLPATPGGTPVASPLSTASATPVSTMLPSSSSSATPNATSSAGH